MTRPLHAVPTVEHDTLADYSAGALIDAVVTLTHIIHGTKDTAKLDDYRARRNLARAELLRRCDPNP